MPFFAVSAEGAALLATTALRGTLVHCGRAGAGDAWDGSERKTATVTSADIFTFHPKCEDDE
jgi:hypothetical protein